MFVKHLDALTNSIDQLNDNTLKHENNMKKAYADAQAVTTSAEKMQSNMQKITDPLAESNLNKTISNLEESLKGINKAVEDLNSDSSSLGLLIRKDEFYNTLNSSVNDLNELLIDLKNNPKRYVHFSIFGRKDKSSDND